MRWARSRWQPPALPENATDEQFEALAWEQLKTIYDPEIPINIVELGLVYECTIRRLPSGRACCQPAHDRHGPGLRHG